MSAEKAQSIENKGPYGEPWTADGDCVTMGGFVHIGPGAKRLADDYMTVVQADMDLDDSDYDREEIMHRIAECVNACRGIDDPTEFIRKAKANRKDER